ncbi:transketolase [Thermoflavifilum aggregans]|uniref:Transketolase n=2 Tax=Thermoflavifilum TaxID=1649506 RepID=A0A1I7N6J0_9BACT|nr:MULTISPECIES: transketolase [Thermoflavifilum]MBX6380659.1 transketolase [Thermoflavifilum aggregans]PJJ74992.1 transketolase [Thermoflavifilum aggregans]SFV30282.1 transketolase [Thermoflavifilum thermophilum]
MASLTEIAAQIRRDIIRMVYLAQSGHPGGSLGCTEFFTALYFQVMKHNPDFTMAGKDEDIFILSNGHISPVYYSTLARAGYFPLKELYTFRKINSRLQGHPTTHEHLPGVRISTGSLGQGMSVAVGAALGKKLSGDKRWVFSLHGDGELEEGQNWEAMMFAAHHKVDNLIATVDWNGQQIDGPTREVAGLGDLVEKFRAFGWETLELKDGNNLDLVIETLEKAKTLTGKGKPVAVLMHTVMGKGVDFMENNHEWHGTAPNEEQFKRAMAQLPETSLGDF